MRAFHTHRRKTIERNASAGFVQRHCQDRKRLGKRRAGILNVVANVLQRPVDSMRQVEPTQDQVSLFWGALWAATMFEMTMKTSKRLVLPICLPPSLGGRGCLLVKCDAVRRTTVYLEGNAGSEGSTCKVSLRLESGAVRSTEYRAGRIRLYSRRLLGIPSGQR